MQKVSIYEKLDLFNEHWRPKIIGEVNDAYVKIAKLMGEFLWHHHEEEDEMFYVLKGHLIIKFRDKDVHLDAGEFIIQVELPKDATLKETNLKVLEIERLLLSKDRKSVV